MDLQNLKYVNELNTEGFIHMLDDPTECYKFYWLSALLSLFSRGKIELTFDELINKMIADAWYSVAEYHLHLGPKNASGKVMNSLERAVVKLSELCELKNDATEEIIVQAIKEHEKKLHEEKAQLIRNVPYRLLSSFMIEIGGNDRIWEQRKRLIAYIGLLNHEKCIPYEIVDGVGLQKKVVINSEWQEFLHDNYATIIGWIELKKVRYLQGRNPGVPGIIYKLEPENDKLRKLKYVRELWNAVIDLKSVKDIYSNNIIVKNDFDIDHFVPWSFVANDELWNLIPMDSTLNSSKSNKLPDWDRYFNLFVDDQFLMYGCVQEYEKIRTIFMNCQRDNLVIPWSLEELYVDGCDKIIFSNVLEKNLHPIYDSARMQGYGIWMTGLL